MAARCRECQYWIVDGKCACNDPTILNPRQTVSRATCGHATSQRRRTTYTSSVVEVLEPRLDTTHAWLFLAGGAACAGCTGWVRQYCPRAKECA